MTIFAIDPERVEYMRTSRVLASPPESGFVQVRRVQTATSDDSEKVERQSWVLAWEFASRADWTAIDGYWNTTKGGALGMTWTPPGGSALSVRMTDWQAESNAEARGYRINVTLEEIL